MECNRSIIKLKEKDYRNATIRMNCMENCQVQKPFNMETHKKKNRLMNFEKKPIKMQLALNFISNINPFRFFGF